MRRHIVIHLLLLLQGATTTTTATIIHSSNTSLLATLAQAMSQVLQQSEMSGCSTLYIHLQYSAPSSRPQLLELLSRLLAQKPQPLRMQLVQLAEQRGMTYKPFRHAVLLLVDDVPALRRIYGGLRATSNLSYTLVYMLQPQQQPTLAMQLFWQRSVLNVALMLHPRLELLSYFPFGRDCQLIRASIVNRYNALTAQWQSGLHFPHKLGNFNGCTLICATWPDMPYLVQRDEGSFVGIEGALLTFMANNLNFSVDIHWLNQSQVRDTFNETGWVFEQVRGTPTMYISLSLRLSLLQIFAVADYALGGFHYRPRNDSNTASEVPYSQSMYYFMSHIMLVTNLPSAYSAYEKLTFPFHPHLWLAIGLVLALSSLVICLLRCYWKPLPQVPLRGILVEKLNRDTLSA